MRHIYDNKSTSSPSCMCAVSVTAQMQSQPGAALRVESWGWADALIWRTEQGAMTRVAQWTSATRDEFWRELYDRLRPRRTTWLWVHGAGRFARLADLPREMEEARLLLHVRHTSTPDLAILAEHAPIGSGAWIDGEPPTILSLATPSEARLVILDLANWVDVDHRQLIEMAQTASEMLGAPDLPGMPSVGREMGDHLAIAHIVSWVQRWVTLHDLGMLRPTLAAQAMSAYRHRFARTAATVTCGDARRPDAAPRERRILYPRPHGVQVVTWAELAGYYGGRVDCFFVGDCPEPVSHVDISAAYATTMSSLAVPAELRRWHMPGTPCQMPDDVDPACALAWIRLDARAHEYPLRRGDGVAYVRGRIETVLAGPEYSRALRAGEVEAVLGWTEYDCQPLLADFADWALDQRGQAALDRNKLLTAISKAMPNALYGKWAQRRSEWDPVYDRLAREPWTRRLVWDGQTGAVTEERSIGWSVERRRPQPVATVQYLRAMAEATDGTEYVPPVGLYAMPAISAWIASALRCHVDDVRAQAGDRHVYYQHTDSLIIGRESWERLSGGDRIAEIDGYSWRWIGNDDNCRIRDNSTLSICGRDLRGSIRAEMIHDGERQYVQPYAERIGGLLTRQSDGTWRSADMAVLDRGGRLCRIVGPDGYTEPVYLT